MRRTAYGLLLLNTILWGFASPIIKYSLQYLSTNQFLLGRFILATIFFAPFYLIGRHKSKNNKLTHNGLLLVSLSLLGTPLTLIPLYEGLKMTSSLTATILVSTGPLFVILGGWIFLKEKIANKELKGILLAVSGTLVISFSPLLSKHSSLDFSLGGNLLIILSNLVWATYLIMVKKLKVSSNDISFISFLVSIPVFAILSLLDFSITQTHQSPSLLLGLPGVLYMGIFGSVIAFWAYNKGQQYIEASEAVVFTYLQPLFALPLSILWLKETLNPLVIIGSLIIVSGVYLSESR